MQKLLMTRKAHSRIAFAFVNAIADEVAKKYPDKLIDTLAYMHTQDAPRITRPRPNFRIRMCPIYVCQYHQYDKCDWPENIKFTQSFKKWTQITDTLYIWHYSCVYSHMPLPLPDLKQITGTFRLYKNSGVKGVMIEGNNIPTGVEFMRELKTYLLAKLLWDVSQDEKLIINDFLNGYYGKAHRQ